MIRACAWILLAGVATALGCEEERPALAEPPDMSGLIGAYQQATGELTRETGPRVAQAFADKITPFLAGIEIWTLLMARVQDFGNALGAGEQSTRSEGLYAETRQALSVTAGGLGRLTYICRGWDPQAPSLDRDISGRVVLENRFGANGLGPAFWGTVEHCKERHEEKSLVVHGAIQAHMKTSDQEDGHLLLDFVGTYGTQDAEPIDIALDLGVVGNLLVTRIELDPDHPGLSRFLVGFDTTQEGSGIQVQDKSGVWACGFDDDNARCELGEERLEW